MQLRAASFLHTSKANLAVSKLASLTKEQPLAQNSEPQPTQVTNTQWLLIFLHYYVSQSLQLHYPVLQTHTA